MDVSVKPIVYSALFIALISIGAMIAIPVGPVPIVLQNMFVLLSGLILPPAWAAGSEAVYLLMGFAGLPVFAGGTSGIGKVFGPTGGYLLSYLPAAFLTSVISGRAPKSLVRDYAAAVSGMAMIYLFGVPWLKWVLAVSWGKALAAGMYPFLIGAVLKIAAAVIIARKLRHLIRF
ncbi:MAG: biotin transporter BioY [Desulfobacterales bacterium]|nr:biotin transporter BioY [Desulfobacterales bacterium]